MKKLLIPLLAVLLVFLFLLPLSATVLPQNKRIATAVEAVDVALGEDTPGAAVLLFEEGERSMFESFGYADISARTRVTAETAFELGELSALFVALAVKELAASELLDPTKDIAAYLSEDFMQQLGLNSPVTTEQLLHGTAGFEGRTFDLRYAKDRYCFDTLEAALLAQIPSQIAAPAQYHSYSAFGIGLAAYVVECVSGQAYEAYVKEKILVPLGMTQTVLNPRADSLPENIAKGHIKTAQGEFCIAAHDGRSYAGIWPADGAVSTPADLSALLAYLLQEERFASLTEPLEGNGIFGAPAIGFLPMTQEGVMLLRGDTAYFELSLVVDTTAKSAALVLANTRDSSLMSLPCKLFDARLGRGTDAVTGGVLLLEKMEGYYAPASLERKSLVGRLQIRQSSVKLELLEDGTIRFGELHLYQVASGVFAEVGAEEPIAVLQILGTVQGESSVILCADGVAYLPASFFETAFPAELLLWLLLLLALYFILGGVFSLWRAVRSRAKHCEKPIPWRFALYWASAALLGMLTWLQYTVAVKVGASVLGSFFGAMSIISLVVAIATVFFLIFAFLTAFTEHKRLSRVVQTAVLFLLFLVLCAYWRVIVI